MPMTDSSNSAPSTQTPVAGPRPECPTLTSDQGTWLKKNYLPGYMQAVDAARAKKPNALHVRGPGKEFVKNHVLNVFIDQFWDRVHEPNTASVMQKVKKYLENHYKTFDKKSGTDHRAQPPPHCRTNAKEQFRLVMAEQIKCNVPNNLDLFREVSGDMWGAISDAEHQKYQAKADELNSVIAEGPALQYIYEMQPYIAEVTEADLSQLIGFQHNQFGKVAWVAHCMYEDENGEVQHKCVKVHSKSKSWGSIPDNDLQSVEYRTAVCTWATRGFDEPADKLVKPSDSQQGSIVEADNAKGPSDNANNSDPSTNHSKTKPRMKNNKKNSEKESNVVAETVTKEKETKEEQERAMRDAEESATKEREVQESAAKGREEKEIAAKETKGKRKTVRGQKRPNDTVDGDVNAPPAKKQGRSVKNTIADDNPPSPPQPQCSARAGKGENPSNYKLIGGKYVGK
ncbi:hypothetical protein EDD18DRAFT_1108697 [Armillaria luteobubalina]|uniref:Uncharacterized protein n=1 Tax=Armillaria luteobubalina TaxID=153913 RepID=A0AA39PY15_9AGAR|nr:hypothetical protein EDD18DRAFT_1108697 [Armillaria luteobubalina]